MIDDTRTHASAPCTPPGEAEQTRSDDRSQERQPAHQTRQTAAGRVLALLSAFGHGGGALTLSELSRQARLSLTTTHRLVRELRDWGGLVMDSEGRYRLSNRFLQLASHSADAFRLRECALPHLIALHQQTGLSIQLGAREGNDVLYLEALRVHPNYSGENRIGGRMPLHATASGLVLLAHADEPFIEEYLASGLTRFTPHTVVEPGALRENLAEVRRRRYAIAHQAVALDAGSVAAPVTGPDLEVIASINVLYFRDLPDPHRLAKLVLETASRVSRAMNTGSGTPDPRTIDFNRRQAGLL